MGSDRLANLDNEGHSQSVEDVAVSEDSKEAITGNDKRQELYRLAVKLNRRIGEIAWHPERGRPSFGQLSTGPGSEDFLD
ncbi:hypothetical protein H7X68_01720 [Candidatus Saccharibacteria bacterium]|nr:hypothetical protein [Candidatus Saccharibacteria bacterium]